MRLDAWIVIVLLGVVIMLYASTLPKQASRKLVDEEVLDSVEGTLQQFVDEMEEDNKEFIQMVGEMKREHERQTSKLLQRIEYLEHKTELMAERKDPPAPIPIPSMPEPAPAQAPSSLKLRYKELFALHDKGKSIEYIAKKLGTNKGEVQLIIQLAKREVEQTNASQ